MGRYLSGALTLLLVASFFHGRRCRISGVGCKTIKSSKEKCQNTDLIFVKNQIVLKGELDVKFETSGHIFSWYCGSSKRVVVSDKPANEARVSYQKNGEVEIFVKVCPRDQLLFGESGSCYDEDFSFACPGKEGKGYACSYKLTIGKETNKVTQVPVGEYLNIKEKFPKSLSVSSSRKDVHTFGSQKESIFVVPAGSTFCSYRKATYSSIDQSYVCSGTYFNVSKLGSICSGKTLCNRKKRSCFPDKHNISNRPNFHFAFYFVILLVFLFI